MKSVLSLSEEAHRLLVEVDKKQCVSWVEWVCGDITARQELMSSGFVTTVTPAIMRRGVTLSFLGKVVLRAGTVVPNGEKLRGTK